VPVSAAGLRVDGDASDCVAVNVASGGEGHWIVLR
jgi:hypothetical protein